MLKMLIFRAITRALLLATAAAAVSFANVGVDSVAVDAGIDGGRDFVIPDVFPESVTVGDVITMSLSIAIPRGARVVLPETDKGFGDFAVLSWDSENVAGGDDGADTAKYQYRLATFKPQNCTIPSLRFLIGVDTLADTVRTAPVPVAVLSVIPEDTPDSGLVIRDLKAQQRVGGADIRYLWILAVAAVAALAYYLLGKYAKKKASAETPIPLKPPYEEAVEAIDTLENKGYLACGMVREYTFELSEIFKRYIGRRYDTIASELTTEEIVAWLEFADISVDMRLCAERFFRTGDRVKFAKWKPDQQTVDGFIKDVRTFLEATKPEPQLPYEQKTERMAQVQ